jgi:hypothetical protein
MRIMGRSGRQRLMDFDGVFTIFVRSPSGIRPFSFRHNLALVHPRFPKMSANSENLPPEPQERLDKDHGDEVPPTAPQVAPTDRKKRGKKADETGLL